MTDTSNPKNSIQFIITGGTIDSVWSGKQDTAVVSQHSVLPDYFKNHVGLYHEPTFTEVCMKDSRAITAEDRKNILKAIEESQAVRIIVTHGTYTMPDTARFVQANLKRKDQVVIFTGSMTPLAGFQLSDAPFNLGFAVSESKQLKQGVYVCMNGMTFSPEEIAKDIAEGKFYSIFKDNQ